MYSPKLVDSYIDILDNKKFSVCYYTDDTHQPNSPPHYNIFVPITDNTCLLVCFITSHPDNRVRFYSNNALMGKKLISSLVFIEKKDFIVLTKKSVIDCNQIVQLTRDELKKRIRDKSEFKVIKEPISKEIQKKIISAIKNSPAVASHIKSLII